MALQGDESCHLAGVRGSRWISLAQTQEPAPLGWCDLGESLWAHLLASVHFWLVETACTVLKTHLLSVRKQGRLVLEFPWRAGHWGARACEAAARGQREQSCGRCCGRCHTPSGPSQEGVV